MIALLYSLLSTLYSLLSTLYFLLSTLYALAQRPSPEARKASLPTLPVGG